MSPEGQRQIDFAERQNRNSYDGDGSYTQPSASRGMGQNNASMRRPMKTNQKYRRLLESIIITFKMSK